LDWHASAIQAITQAPTVIFGAGATPTLDQVMCFGFQRLQVFAILVI
jgi:hypothetical protein